MILAILSSDIRWTSRYKALLGEDIVCFMHHDVYNVCHVMTGARFKLVNLCGPIWVHCTNLACL